MNSKSLNLLMIQIFPNLKSAYVDETNWQDGDETGSHVVYGDVFAPYILDMIECDNHSELKKIFEFIEYLLGLGDGYVDSVVSCSIIESIAHVVIENEVILSLLQEKSKGVLLTCT